MRVLVNDRIILANSYTEAREVALEASRRLPNTKILVLLHEADEVFINGKATHTISRLTYATNNFIIRK